MTPTEIRSIALLIGVVVLAGCLPDEFAYEYDWLHPETLASGSDIPLDTLFPGRWEHVCIQAPGGPSIGLVEQLGLNSGAEWISDGRLHDSDFTTSVYKIIVMSEEKSLKFT